ncbi:DUF6447 family protein [Halomonas dongshanensis]|uniref:DUF6447 family protein n=1 Tax=Halomonas dongshanensis TaxID=2890835 RepID=A0ABT2EIZ8_9GAMM|nr:DUF6447 family protein [Halomonas dongshanensis]MCS2611090.1 DUF6447 family protein [Halomonas dongshanensis]
MSKHQRSRNTKQPSGQTEQPDIRTKEGAPQGSAQPSSPTVTIDGMMYTLESLGQKGREQLRNVRVTDQEIQRLQDQLAMIQTARNTYARLLSEAIKNAAPVG